MSFPVEAVPDGAVFAPHHYIIGMLVVMVSIFVVWDNFNDREPLESLVFAGIGLFGFLLVWPYYPVAGAAMSLAGPAFVILIVLVGWAGLTVGDEWDDYPVRFRLVAIGGSLLALDDGVEHAFGLWTPFDWIWNEFLYESIGEIALIVTGAVLVGGAIYLVWSENRNKN